MSDEGSSLFLCPHCGAFINESSTKCPNCDNLLEDDLGDENLELELDELQVDAETSEEPDEEPPSQTEPLSSEEEDEGAVTLFLCSVCGAFTGGGAENCPQCGASMMEEDDESLPAIQPDEVESNVMDMLVEAVPDDVDSTEIAASDEDDDALMDNLMNIESAEDVMNFVESLPDEPQDEELELDLEPPDEGLLSGEQQEEVFLSDEQQEEVLPERSQESDDVLSQLVYLSEDIEDDEPDDRSTAINAVEDMLASEPEKQKDDDTIAMCNSCGAFVSESAEVCNVCGNSLKDDKKFTPVADESVIDDPEEEEADSIIRSLLGVDQDAELDDEEDRFQADGNLGLCTVCGAFISEYADACTVCGTHLDEMPEFMPSMDLADKLTDNKSLALCPHCGVFIHEGATECMSCIKPIPEGAKLDMVELDESQQDSDHAFHSLKTFLGVEKSLELEPTRDQSMSGLDVCPDCGAFVSLRAVSCSVCGNSLFDGPPESLIQPEEKMECPNCGSKIASGSPECPLCGIAFATDELNLELEGPGEDITDFLEMELEESIRNLEEKAGVELLSDEIQEEELLAESEEPEETVPDDDIDVSELIILDDEPEIEELPDTVESEAQLDDSAPEALTEPSSDHDELWADDGLEEQELEEDISGMLEELEESDEEEIIESPESEEPPEEDDDFVEPLEFIDDESDEIELVESEPGDEYVEEDVVEEVPVDRDLSRFDSDSRQRVKPANWGTGIYVSVAAICFFLGFYAIVPGPSYAPGLAVIFGTLLLIGVYLLLTEKGTFFKGDLKASSVFFSGIIVAAIILLHWPMGILTSYEGFLRQPRFDSIMLSISILLVSVGILWIRARVRYVFTWFAGILLLFLGALLQFTYLGWENSSSSPVLLVAGLGASLVFISLVFLQYERAINTSIESDVVRGDAHYLRRDYKGAMASYDDAISKSQIKRVEVLGSPLIEYDVPWYSKGSALILMGEYEEGIKALDMALAINPNNEVTWVNKGNAHSKLGEHDVAMECYERSISVNPFYEIAWNNLGNVMARRKEYVESLKHYNRAIKINPKYDDAWINKGYVLAKMGKKEQAIKCLSHVGSRAKVDLPGTEPEVSPASEA
ncbi:MAG: tetratricopeptide repeat protein [Thermoplasmata archaeon]|nr:tetratricopeptide repeat protein [Thermoplasmata archaeon]